MATWFAAVGAFYTARVGKRDTPAIRGRGWPVCVRRGVHMGTRGALRDRPCPVVHRHGSYVHTPTFRTEARGHLCTAMAHKWTRTREQAPAWPLTHPHHLPRQPPPHPARFAVQDISQRTPAGRRDHTGAGEAMVPRRATATAVPIIATTPAATNAQRQLAAS